MNKILENMNKLDADSYTTEDLKKIASLDGVTHFLSGAVTKFGEKIRLNISIQKAGTWKTTWSDQIDGTENDMFAMVDVLTKTLKPNLNLTEEQIADDFDKAVADVTTPNERALQFYIQARRAMNDTDWNLATELFQRAVALDPDFAMAYRFLSGVYNHLALATGDQSYWDKLHEAGKKSLEAAKSRPPSERERLTIEGAYINPSNVAEGIETFKKLLELYPDDDYGNYRLGTSYFQGQAYDRAEKYLERTVGFTNSAFTFYNLSKIYLDQGRYDEADDVLKVGLERFPNNTFIYQRMAQLHAAQQEFDEALLWCNRGFEVEPIQFRDSLVRGDVLFFMGDFSATEEEYRSCYDSKNKKTRIDAAISLFQLYITQGRYEDARVQAETAKQNIEKNREWDFDPINIEMTRLYAKNGSIQKAFKTWDEVVDKPTRSKLRGEIYAWAKQWPEAEKVLLEVEQAIQEYDKEDWPKYLAQNDMEGPKRRRMRNAIYSIGARMALERGDYAQAIAYMEQAKTLYTGSNLIPADLIEILGKAYYKSGDLESAREQFEWISRMTNSRKEYGDIYSKSFHMLGKIYEQMGKKKEAIKNYEKFLDLWKNADPGLPEVDDAKAKLASLKN
jgi:tetratricopeptide (TPR) repeat protein